MCFPRFTPPLLHGFEGNLTKSPGLRVAPQQLAGKALRLGELRMHLMPNLGRSLHQGVGKCSKWTSPKWRFPEMGPPPVIIHFRMGFSQEIHHSAILRGTLIYGNPQILGIQSPSDVKQIPRMGHVLHPVHSVTHLKIHLTCSSAPWTMEKCGQLPKKTRIHGSMEKDDHCLLESLYPFTTTKRLWHGKPIKMGGWEPQRSWSSFSLKNVSWNFVSQTSQHPVHHRDEFIWRLTHRPMASERLTWAHLLRATSLQQHRFERHRAHQRFGV